MGTAPLALEIKGLTVSYHEKPVLRNINLAVPAGKLVGVIGPNGAGKSTLLKAVLGLIPCDAGQVRVLGKPLHGNRLCLTYVPQTETVDWDFPVTAGEVVMMGRYGHLGHVGRPTRDDKAIVWDCLKTVAMLEFADRHIRQLSGGQQQRIFLARALAQQASILLLDEPFAGVDARTEHAMFDLMRRFSNDGKTLVVVHHDLEIMERFDLALLLNRSVFGFGKVAEVVTHENLRRAYGGQMRFLEEAERQLQAAPDYER